MNGSNQQLGHIPGEAPETFWEREISVTFENGGHIEITVRGQSIAGVLEILLNTLSVVPLDLDAGLALSLRYYHLDEDCGTQELTAYEACYEFETNPMRVIRRMAADAKTSLVQKLVQHHITLQGERGEL